jgi:hypothetical protein
MYIWKCHYEPPLYNYHILTKMLLLKKKKEGQEGKIGPVLEWVSVGGGRAQGKGEGG